MIQVFFKCKCGFETESISDALNHTNTNWAFTENHEMSQYVNEENMRLFMVESGVSEPSAEDE